MVYGLAGREPEAKAVLSIDLSPAQVQNNLSYYRELRAMMQKGKPIGNFDQMQAKPQQVASRRRLPCPARPAGQPRPTPRGPPPAPRSRGRS